MKIIIALAAFSFLFQIKSYSQGCVIVRNISGFGQYNLADNSFTTSTWQLNVINRYFRSFRDFEGSTNVHTPPQNENEIKSFSTDIALSQFFNKGWSADLDLPVNANSRTSNAEHGGPGTTRYTTHAFGIGDIRLTVYKWILPSYVAQQFNLQIGLGLKFPTGDYRYQDYFHLTDTTILAPVNFGIQLGDGGTGIITQLNGYYFFNKQFSMYGNFYYLISPREQNGVSTTSGKTPPPLQVTVGNNVTTVPDVLSIRAGFIYNLKKMALSAGYLEEGVPVHDLVGGSGGLRRPGHNVSVEPGIIYKMKKISLYGYVPVGIAHRINQSVPDKMLSQIKGVYTAGTGGSGIYQIFVGATFKL